MIMKKRAICILGMHRSGTSAVARMVNLMGAYLGEDSSMVPAGPDNREGFWEHASVVKINERILKAFGRSWDTVLPLSNEWWVDPEVRAIRDKAKDFVNTEFGDKQLWAWKDPRTCLTLPFWIEILNELEIDVRFVLVVRGARSVAESLKKRNGFETWKALGMWQLYNLSAFYWTSGMSRMVIRFEDFLAAPLPQLEILAQFLEVPLSESREEDVLNAFKPNLVHNRFALDETDNMLPRPIRDTESLLFNGPNQVADDDFQKTVTYLYSEYIDYAKLVMNGRATLATNEPAKFEILQFFWSKNGLFNEANSAYVAVNNDNEYHTYETVIPQACSKIRIDPTNFPAEIMIKSVGLVGDDGKRYEFDLSSAITYEGVKLPDSQPFTLFAFTNDPQVYLDVPGTEEFNHLPLKMQIVMKVNSNMSQVFGKAISSYIVSSKTELEQQKHQLQVQLQAIDQYQVDIAGYKDRISVLESEAMRQSKDLIVFKQQLEVRENELGFTREQLKTALEQNSVSKALQEQVMGYRRDLSFYKQQLDVCLGHVSSLSEIMLLREEQVQTERARTESRLHAMELELESTIQTLTSLKNSASWRITEPLRRIGNALRS